MSDFIYINIIVEGMTEHMFVKTLLAPYLEKKRIYIITQQVNNKVSKGGDVRFSNVKKDIVKLLKNKSLYITTLIDYYGIKKWVKYEESKKIQNHKEKYNFLCQSTEKALKEDLKENNYEAIKRFIPHFSMHEFEALLFSNASILAESLKIPANKFDAILNQYENDPEQINSNNHPSQRIKVLYNNYEQKYDKHEMGIDILEKIPIDEIRKKCQLFGEWLTKLEKLKPLL